MRKLEPANALTLTQQRKAIKLLKNIVEENDVAASGEDDYPSNLAARVFLIQVGAIPDRRKK